MSNCPGNLPLLRFPLHGKIQAFQAPSSLKRQNNFCYVTVRVVVSSGSLSSGPCCPDVWRPRLEDSVVTLPFVVWTIRKAELMTQRHIRGHWHGWSHRLPQQCLQQHLHTGLTAQAQAASWAGREGSSPVWAHIQFYNCTASIPDSLAHPTSLLLPGRYIVVLASKRTHALTYIEWREILQRESWEKSYWEDRTDWTDQVQGSVRQA